MTVKLIFGALLTFLGIASLAYTMQVFLNAAESTIKSLIVYGILALFFFIAGINLIRPAKEIDDSF